MDSWEIGRLTYLVLLGAALVFWYIVQGRESIGKTIRLAAAWVFIFIGVIAVIGLWEDIRNTVRPMQSVDTVHGRVEIPRSHDGHYYATLNVNGKPVTFLVDTGASDIVLTLKDADRAGLDTGNLAFVGRAMTANGEVRTAPVEIDSIALGPAEDRNLRAFVNSGDMEQSLLGMAYLQRWGRIEIAGGSLILTR